MRDEPGQFFFLATQGCKVNQYESQAIREAWTSRGLLETDNPALAGVILINSCAVTERAVLDLGKMVRGFAILEPKPRIVVTGCAVEADYERLASLPGVDEIISQRGKTSLSGLKATPGAFLPLSIANSVRSRAAIKVQDGCSHGCTYCIIPRTRGRSTSRAPGEVVDEARRLLASGIRELTLCGINLRHYGRDLSPLCDFWDLLATLEQELTPNWAGQMRLRLSSLEPGDLTPKALGVLAASPLICPHLHLSLQSGSPAVLRRMGRGHYGPDDVFKFVENLCSVWPVFGLGADFITGFPGETEAQFQETLSMAEKLPLSYAHVFPYSERPGTPAAGFPASLPDHVRRERAKRLRQTVQQRRQFFLRSLLGLEQMHVVLEKDRTGMNEFYVECHMETPWPESYVSRELLAVRPVGLASGGLRVRAFDAEQV